MRKVVSKLDEMLIGMKVRLAQKKPAVDQIIIMFIIIAVHHHIISIPKTGRERNVLSDAGDILLLLLENKVNLVLSGHKHVPHVWKMNNTIFSTAGTVSSMKLRGNTHPSYNIVEINNEEIEITLCNYDGTTKKLSLP